MSVTIAYFQRRSTVDANGCWIWSGATRKEGYGHLGLKGYVSTAAHRVAYEVTHGPIPAGLTVDHKCFVEPCVNPEHLRLLTRPKNAGNTRRSFKTHCTNGHEYSPENTYRRPNGRRDCRACIRLRVRKYTDTKGVMA